MVYNCRLAMMGVWRYNQDMRVQDRLLAYFKQHTDEHLSGQFLASELSVSRAAIWKAIQELKSQGFEFCASTNKGYRLVGASQSLSRQALVSYLSEEQAVLLQFHEELESTNKSAKVLAMEGAPHGTVVVAARQTAGRGRRGRSFSSPEGGLYMSVVLRPSCDSNVALLVTSATAVAVAQAVSQVCNLEVSIKWVNDLFFQGRKVCGILTEGVADLETGNLDCIVVGVGINFSTPTDSFAPELQSIAGSLYEGSTAVPPEVDVNRLVVEVYERILALSDSLEDRDFIQEYRSRSFLIGQEVTVLGSDCQFAATVTGIDDDCHLLVRKADGEEVAIGTGEVSIRFCDEVRRRT